jgi:SAM-dependent methyltransferase
MPSRNEVENRERHTPEPAARSAGITRYLRDNWALTGQLGRHAPPRRVALVGRWITAALVERALDRYYALKGLETSGRDHGHYGSAGLCYGYVPTPWLALQRMFPADSLGVGDVVLEYGCGKGRALAFIASRFPVRRVTGIEIDPDLCADAEANLRRLPRCRPAATEVLPADATTFEVPGDVTVAYFYNPFRGEVFEEVLARLRESLERSPRPLRIVYFHPLMHDAVIRAGFTLERHERNRSWHVQVNPDDHEGPPVAPWMPPYAWAVYRATVPGEPGFSRRPA